MGTANVEKMSDKELLGRVHSFHVTDFDLMRDLEISEPTLRNYKKDGKRKKKRVSEPRMKLFILNLSLTRVKDLGYSNAFEIIKNVLIQGVPFLKFVNEHATDGLIEIVVEQALELQLSKKAQDNSLEIYRMKYKYLNDETLRIASKENPELLIKLIDDTNLRPSTRGDILEALSIGGRKEYFAFIKDKIDEPAPHLREAAFNGLYEYYSRYEEFAFLRNLFEEKFSQEQAKGVRDTISELLEEMSAA